MNSTSSDLGSPHILEDLGNAGDFIGGIAVVATLLYLAIQVRHNTASVRAASRQDVVESFRSFNRLLLEAEGLPEVFLRGLVEYPDMEQPDRLKFGAHMSDHLLHFQGAFALRDSGILDAETYEAYLDFFAMFLSTPGGAAYWSEFRAICPVRAAGAVDTRLAAGELPNLLDLRFYQKD